MSTATTPIKKSSKKQKLHGAQRSEPPYNLYANATTDSNTFKDNEVSFDLAWKSVVQLLRGRKNIAILTGAGISVSCGIPDFRTKGSGLYSTLDTAVRINLFHCIVSFYSELNMFVGFRRHWGCPIRKICSMPIFSGKILYHFTNLHERYAFGYVVVLRLFHDRVFAQNCFVSNRYLSTSSCTFLWEQLEMMVMKLQNLHALSQVILISFLPC
jgi:Sir2 family